jgi:hypothetical protein
MSVYGPAYHHLLTIFTGVLAVSSECHPERQGPMLLHPSEPERLRGVQEQHDPHWLMLSYTSLLIAQIFLFARFFLID